MGIDDKILDKINKKNRGPIDIFFIFVIAIFLIIGFFIGKYSGL